MSEALINYVRGVGVNEPGVLRRLREETARLPNAQMQITPEQGQFLRVILKAIGAKKTLEIGVFTGYSSTLTALALPAGGRVIACDRSEEYTTIARRYWKEAGVEGKIELRLGPALETVRKLVESEKARETFDFAFIDADKSAYDAYYECALQLVRRGGIIALDNMLWHGRVLDQDSRDPDTLAIQALNRKIREDQRVVAALVPVGDGITVAWKR
ncbi:MAG: class I SAM-dependent methyltransferase [Bryobacteraceae bacterium]